MDKNDNGPSYIRRAVQEMPPKFDPPTQGWLRHAGLDTGRILPMGLNECLLPPSPRVIEAIQAALPLVNRYPDAQCPALTDVISARTGVAPSHIVWGNGSEEMIQGCLALAVSPGDRVVLPTPTFWGYRAMIRASGAQMIEAPNHADGSTDVDAIIARAREGARIAFCITPNNPTGAMLGKKELEKLVAQVPRETILFFDEAYYEFGVHAGGPDVLAIVSRRDGPWMIARTFSKAYAMAGLRAGYALCDSETLSQALKKTTCVFNVPILAQAAALAALEDRAHLNWILDTIAAGRAQLARGMREMGLEPMGSVGNFVSARVPMPGRAAVKAMLERHVQINAWADPGFEHYIRITVGTEEQNRACLEALRDTLAQEGRPAVAAAASPTPARS